MKKIYQCIVGMIFFLNVCPGVLSAEPVRDAHVTIGLVTDVSSIQPGRPFWVAVYMDMDEKWQVYWKNPGDSGLPTKIAWNLPQDFKASDIYWPFPIRMDYSELTSYGYEGEVVLLCELTPPEDLDAGSLQDIKAYVKWLSCGNICIPGKANLSLELPVSDGEPLVDGSVREMFGKIMMDWPLSESGWGVQASMDGESFYLRLTAPESQPPALTLVEFFPEDKELIDHMAGQVLTKKDDGYELIVSKSVIYNKDASRLKGVLVSKEGWQEGRRALAVDVPVHNIGEKE